MADASLNRSGSLLRFAALSLLGLAAETLLFHLLLKVVQGPLLTRAVSLVAILGIMLALLRRIDFTTGGRLSVGRAGIVAIVLIAAILNYGLYATLITVLPSLQPLAAMVLASASTLCFAIFGYIRFAFRE
ncbi:GtrA family protein [Rhizobium sp. 007]|uniref:GtrA family protein n=1 Tax=Rhizobium sp. 007 TaxID=2785056 RepID=UPI00188F85CF|nr:GtrA family protein [Rhizobium sp. 007]QPB19885.1 GtrA family protein [Rhizobium sp. 007]